VSSWKADPRLPYVVAIILGMIAGVAAKQAVSITAGKYPKPIGILADCLVLGIVFLIVMYVHAERPSIPVEGIALISSALAMWGPRGISALLQKFQVGALSAAEAAAKQFINPVEPVRRPTVPEAVEHEREEAMDPARETKHAQKAPVRRLRDIIPPEEQLPADELGLLSQMDRLDPDYVWVQPLGTKRTEGDM
jgi:hypothetical protein